MVKIKLLNSFYQDLSTLQKNEPLIINGKGNQIRGYCNSNDVAKGIEKSFSNKIFNEIINLGNSQDLVTLKQLAKLVIKSSKSSSKIKFDKKFQDTDRESSREIYRRYCSTKKAKKLLNFRPTINLKTGITELVNLEIRDFGQNKMKIGNKKINNKSKPLLIAEIGINHNGDLDLAKKMTISAIDSGADIVKFQTHLVDDEMLNIEDKKASHVKGSLYEILKQCSLNLKAHIELKKLCESKNKIFMSTPFSVQAVDLLSKIGVKAFKIGSGETNNYHFVEYVLKK